MCVSTLHSYATCPPAALRQKQQQAYASRDQLNRMFPNNPVGNATRTEMCPFHGRTNQLANLTRRKMNRQELLLLFARKVTIEFPQPSV